ncbi:MAG: hypothetical protein IJX96_00345 [Clostridia bacterium]|nr:hypothetical protein [Clostridia bacterium]
MQKANNQIRPENFELWDIVSEFEIETVKFEVIRTLLDEIADDLDPEIKFDGTDEDEHRKVSLLSRRHAMSNLLRAALEFIVDLQTVSENTIEQLQNCLR